MKITGEFEGKKYFLGTFLDEEGKTMTSPKGLPLLCWTTDRKRSVNIQDVDKRSQLMDYLLGKEYGERESNFINTLKWVKS
jgi:hypothetical protein